MLSASWMALLSKCCHRKREVASVAPSPKPIQRQGDYGKGAKHHEIPSCHWCHYRMMSVLLKPCDSAVPGMKMEYIFWEGWFQLPPDSLELRLLCGLCHQLFMCSNWLLRLPATGSCAAGLQRKKCQSLLPSLTPYLLDKPALCPAAPLLGHDAIEVMR